MSELILIALVLVGIIAFALLSQRIERSFLTLPMVFAGLGWAISAAGGAVVPMEGAHDVIHTLAEITLVIVLFADASRVRLADLGRSYGLPLRMLLIGMPLTILLGTLVAHWVSPAAPWALALLVAAILTPTDAALGQAVVSSPSVPLRLRQSINVESGLNDGFAVPVIIVAALWSATATGTPIHDAPDNLYLFTAMQVVLGPLAGIAVGWVFAMLLDQAVDGGHITPVSQGVAFLCAAPLAFVLAEAIGGNGLIASFLAGLVFGNSFRNDAHFIEEFMEGEGQLLTIFTFLIFGAVLVPLGLEHATWRTVVLAILYLTVIRMIPIWVSLAGSGLSAYDKVFLGWFGPRGLASILFALLIYERFPVPGVEEILACVVLTVMLSIVLHGVTANPMAARFREEAPDG